MNKKRQMTELALWLAALVAAVVLTSSADGWHKSQARRSPSYPAAQATMLR